MRLNFLGTTEIVSFLTMEVLLPSSKQKSSLCKETAVPTLASIMAPLPFFAASNPAVQYIEVHQEVTTTSRPSTSCRLKLILGAWGFWSKALSILCKNPVIQP